MKQLIVGLLMTLTALTANNLKNEQSPYLQQHADNPVNWMPWTKSSLAKAKKENKLIFLSIGYSTCHWCHVMEEESFEREDVAKVLNQDYIAIKIDREEMPQLDSYYQHIYQVMHGRGGGWPLTIIMTPDAKPFWSATYLPRADLIRILTEISKIYAQDKSKITNSIQELTAIMKRLDQQKSQSGNSDLNQTITVYTKSLTSSFDEMSGGFGGAPKFPRATLLESMLDLYAINHDTQLLIMAEATLKGMAEGGIYDQIESGFYRYSVDGQWHIPHFEKMLYTQAELLRVYSKAYLLTGKESYKRIVTDLIVFLHTHFDKEGLFYSASDADSLTPEGKKEEGYYFVYHYKSTYAFLRSKGYSKAETETILAYFHITPVGNFENGNSNPHIQESQPLSDLPKIKAQLAELRSQKAYPFVDQKILTAWNAMAISALLQAGKIDPQYGTEALQRLDRLLKQMRVNGTLYHQKLWGKELKVVALFEDYAFLIDTLVDAYEVNYNQHYITLARSLADEAIKKFYAEGSWYLSDDAYRTKASFYDSAYASPASVMTRALFKLALQTDDPDLYAIAERSITQNPKHMQLYPDSIATAFDTFVGYKTGYKVLKSTKENLLTQKKKIEALHDPYLISRAVDLEKSLYIGCTIQSCFVTSERLMPALEEIAKRTSSIYLYSSELK